MNKNELTSIFKMIGNGAKLMAEEALEVAAKNLPNYINSAKNFCAEAFDTAGDIYEEVRSENIKSSLATTNALISEKWDKAYTQSMLLDDAGKDRLSALQEKLLETLNRTDDSEVEKHIHSAKRIIDSLNTSETLNGFDQYELFEQLNKDIQSLMHLSAQIDIVDRTEIKALFRAYDYQSRAQNILNQAGLEDYRHAYLKANKGNKADLGDLYSEDATEQLSAAITALRETNFFLKQTTCFTQSDLADMNALNKALQPYVSKIKASSPQEDKQQNNEAWKIGLSSYS